MRKPSRRFASGGTRPTLMKDENEPRYFASVKAAATSLSLNF